MTGLALVATVAILGQVSATPAPHPVAGTPAAGVAPSPPRAIAAAVPPATGAVPPATGAKAAPRTGGTPLISDTVPHGATAAGSSESTPRPGDPPGISDAAPRPTALVRVQNRYTTKARLLQLFVGGEYLARGDFFVSPGVRVGGTYHPSENVGIEVRLGRYFASLDDEARRLRRETGYVPDSHAPEWQLVAGVRGTLGYGKLLPPGLGRSLHFEPQAFAHLGGHLYSGDFGPTADVGLGFLFHLTPRLFVRIDGAATFERESRTGGTKFVLGGLPSLVLGGVP